MYTEMECASRYAITNSTTAASIVTGKDSDPNEAIANPMAIGNIASPKVAPMTNKVVVFGSLFQESEIIRSSSRHVDQKYLHYESIVRHDDHHQRENRTESEAEKEAEYSCGQVRCRGQVPEANTACEAADKLEANHRRGREA